MTEPKPPPTLPERDPWLAAALRHAPDAADTPPAALSETILRAAREAATSASAPQKTRASPRGRIAAWWHRLTRPPMAAAFATLLLATAVGVMWWGEPVDPRVAPRGDAGVPAPPAAPSSPEAAAPSLGAAAPVSKLTEPPAPAPALTPPAPAAVADPATGKAEVWRSRPPRPEARAPAVPSTEPRRAPQPPAGVAPQPAARGDTAAVEAVEAGTPAFQDRSAREAESAAAAIAAATKAAVPPRPGLARQSFADPGAPRTPAELFAAVRSAPQRWQWRSGGAAPRAVDAPFLRWWTDLERSTPAWTMAAGDAAGAVAAPRTAAPVLALSADGDRAATVVLSVEGGTLRLRLGNSGDWSAPLDEAAAARLSAALAQLGR